MTIAAVLVHPGDDASENLLWPGELQAGDLATLDAGLIALRRLSL